MYTAIRSTIDTRAKCMYRSNVIIAKNVILKTMFLKTPKNADMRLRRGAVAKLNDTRVCMIHSCFFSLVSWNYRQYKNYLCERAFMYSSRRKNARVCGSGVVFLPPHNHLYYTTYTVHRISRARTASYFVLNCITVLRLCRSTTSTANYPSSFRFGISKSRAAETFLLLFVLFVPTPYFYGTSAFI